MSPRAGHKACRSCAARSGCSPARLPPSPRTEGDRRLFSQAPAIMPLASRRARRPSIDIWPGFVDALAQLLMVIIFILLVFTAGQFFLADALSGRDKALKELQQQVSELSDLLALERSASENLRAEAAGFSSQLTATLAERDALTAQVEELAAKAKAAATQAEQAGGQLNEANTQIGALRA